MYYSHFGLEQAPFKITPNTEFFFSGGNRGPILEALLYAIRQGEGIIKVAGEVGSGKTMLCNMLQARLPEHVETVYIANPSVSPEEILRAIAFELGLKPERAATHLEVMQLLHDYLLERHGAGRQVVVFIEESQGMPLATLEEVRLLSNLETHHHKLLQIVLFGQPELDDNLRNPQIRQLRERITHSFRLAPLNPRDVREYLHFRLRAAGYRGPDLFGPRVVDYIARASEGLTRRVNLIADKALLAAFSEGTHTVRLKHVKAAVRDSEFSRYGRPRMAITGAPALAAALTVVVIGALMALGGEKITDWIEATRADRASPDTPAATAEASETGAPAAPTASAGGSQSGDKSSKKQTVVATNPGVDADADLVATRFAATEAWLAREDGKTVTIQLLGTEDPAQLRHHLNILSKLIEINEIFVYRTIAKDKPSVTVLYGSYADRRAATNALERLPPQLKAYQPYLRTVQGVRAEIASRTAR